MLVSGVKYFSMSSYGVYIGLNEWRKVGVDARRIREGRQQKNMWVFVVGDDDERDDHH